MEPFNPFDMMRRNTRKVTRIREQGNAGSGFRGFGDFLKTRSAPAAPGIAPDAAPPAAGTQPAAFQARSASAITPESFTARSPAREYMAAMPGFRAGTGEAWGEWTPPAQPETNPCERCDPATQECRNVGGEYRCVAKADPARPGDAVIPQPPQPPPAATACPPGSRWNGTRCVSDATTCPPGTRYVGGYCVPNTVDLGPTCPAGYVLQGSQCVPAAAPPPPPASGSGSGGWTRPTCKRGGDNCQNDADCCSGNCRRRNNDNRRKCA